MMKTIESILKISEQGVSRPYLCRDDDGKVRWCKGNHTGIRSLVSEWICGKFARAVGLPIPDFEIFRLDVSEFSEWMRIQNASVPAIVTTGNQHVFGSLNVDNCKDVFDAATDLGHIDRTVLAKIFYFDELIHNTDRTDFNSNLLVNGSAYVIDHNNAFDVGFDGATFTNEHILRGYAGELSAQEVEEFKSKIKDLAGGEFLYEAWDEMPVEWTDVGETVLPVETIRRVILEGCNG